MAVLPPATRLSFVAYGVPIGQAAISYSKAGRGYYPNGKVLKPWRKVVAEAARAAIGDSPLWPLDKAAPVVLNVGFWLPRPKTVKRAYPTVSPDLQHLVRAAEDAMTKIVWHDDSQVVDTNTTKRYADLDARPCAIFWIQALELP